MSGLAALQRPSARALSHAFDSFQLYLERFQDESGATYPWQGLLPMLQSIVEPGPESFSKYKSTSQAQELVASPSTQQTAAILDLSILSTNYFHYLESEN